MRRNTHSPWAPLPVQGQACECGARLFVQEGIYDQFVKKSIELAKQRKGGWYTVLVVGFTQLSRAAQLFAGTCPAALLPCCPHHQLNVPACRQPTCPSPPLHRLGTHLTRA